MKTQTMDRRNFLKGALATGALAAGGAALAGCSPAQPQQQADGAPHAEAAAGAKQPQGYECSED